MELIFILKILYYFLFVFIFYYFSKLEYKKNKKIGFFLILIFALLIGYYGIICGPIPYSLDRLNYAIRFSSDRYLEFVRNNSFGLYLIEKFLHLFSYNPNLLFFFIPFIYFVLTIVSYNKYKDALPLALLLIGLSSYGLFGFYMFKQCIAIALITFSVNYFNEKKFLKSIIFVIIATLFHESSWIVFPIYLVILYGNKSKLKRIITYTLLILCVVFFENISHLIVNIFNFIPGINIQLLSYLNDSGGIDIDMNYLTALKGLPFYVTAFFALIKKRELSPKINNYNNYLIITIFVCCTSLLSSYMYWMWRFGAFFYFPICIFAAQIYKNIVSQKDRQLYIFIMIFSMFLLQLKLLIQYYFIYGGIV